MENNKIIDAINETIKKFPTLIRECNGDGLGYHIWLDGDYDDYEYFMEELNDNLDGWEFRNNIVTKKNLPSYGRCHICVPTVFGKKIKEKEE